MKEGFEGLIGMSGNRLVLEVHFENQNMWFGDIPAGMRTPSEIEIMYTKPDDFVELDRISAIVDFDSNGDVFNIEYSGYIENA